MEKLHKKQDAVKARLEQLNRDFRDLEDLISRGKMISISNYDRSTFDFDIFAAC